MSESSIQEVSNFRSKNDVTLFCQILGTIFNPFWQYVWDRVANSVVRFVDFYYLGIISGGKVA